MFPEATHLKSSDFLFPQWRTLGDFLNAHADTDCANFTFPTAELGEQLKEIPNGSGIKSKGRAEPTRPGGHWGYRQGTFIADQSLPARTVTGSASQDWIRHDGLLRRLTLREVMLLQGFPEDWHILGTKSQKYKQIGNAVPVELGKVVIRSLMEQLGHLP